MYQLLTFFVYMLTTFGSIVVDLDSVFLVYCGRGVPVDGLEDVSVDDGEVTGVCNKHIQLSIII